MDECLLFTASPSCSKQGMDALFWELEQLEFEANKTDILSFTSQRELEAYEALNADISAWMLLFCAL